MRVRIGAVAFGLCFAVIWGASALLAAMVQTAPDPQVRPRYTEDGALLLPDDYRTWVFVGASLGLSYGEGQPGAEMFHETLMEPTAYKHFVATGTFREGTMFALLLHDSGEGVLPARRGRFAGPLRAVEMAVKDTSHRPEGWAYYDFGGGDRARRSAPAMAKTACYDCHLQHARRDNVFVQFYPLLLEAAQRPVQEAGSRKQGAGSRNVSGARATR